MPRDWPANAVESWPIERLTAYDRNARTHTPAQIKQIVSSVKKWGWTMPVLADEKGLILAGHARVSAAREMGLESVPVIVAKGWSASEKRAYILADNKLALNAGWDQDLLSFEVTDLAADGFDLELAGFDLDELAGLTAASDGATDPDHLPKVPSAPVTRSGDIWLLGHHRLLCGDSTDAAGVARLMGDALADVCFTSPPYAQQRNYGAVIQDWPGLMRGVVSAAPLRHSAQLLVNLGMVHRDNEWVSYWDPWLMWMHENKWRRFGWYVWDQGPGMPGDWNGRLAPAHEFIFHFNRTSVRPHKSKAKRPENIQLFGEKHGGMRRKDGSVGKRSSREASLQTHKIPDSVIRVTRHHGGLGKAGSHPAVFPVALAEEMLVAFSDPGDIAYEPFCGGGSQLIAATMRNRRCYAIEISPAYVDVCVRRWQDFTNQSAALEESGRSFEETEADRQAASAEPASAISVSR